MGDDIDQLKQRLYDFIESTNEAALEIDRLANELDQFTNKRLRDVEKAGILSNLFGSAVDLLDNFISLFGKRIPSPLATAGQFATGLGVTIACSSDIIKTVKSMTTYHRVQAIVDKCHRQLTAVSDELSKINVTVTLPERLHKFRNEYLILCRDICKSATVIIVEGKQCMNHIQEMGRGNQIRQCNPENEVTEARIWEKEKGERRRLKNKEPEVLNTKISDSPEKGELVPEKDEKDTRTENRIKKGTEHDSDVSKEMSEEDDDKLHKRKNCELETTQSVSAGKESADNKQTSLVKIFETGLSLCKIWKLIKGDNIEKISHADSLSPIFRNISFDIRETCPRKCDIDEAVRSLYTPRSI